MMAVMLGVILLALFGGCSDDDPSRPTGGGILPTFTSIWPAEVGAYWVFDVESRRYEDVGPTYESPEEVPSIPAMEELYGKLQTGGSGSLESDRHGVWRFEFTGREQSTPEVEAYLAQYSWAPPMAEKPNPPWPVNGTQIWNRTSNRISEYGDSSLTWVHVDGSLKVGHEFKVQLAEEQVSDVFLSSRIWQYLDFEVMGHTIENCLECFYVLDLGIQQATDEEGTPWGFFQSYVFGMIIYAPEIGPVYCLENGIYYPGHEDVNIATLLESGVTGIPAADIKK